MDADFVLFLALTAFAIAIAGATAFVIFWPLALVHIRDRHPQITARLGEGAFLKPKALWWLLRGDGIDVLEGVPTNNYDKSAFYKDGSIMRYNDPNVRTRLGIDVSQYQGDIDWTAVAGSGGSIR